MYSSLYSGYCIFFKTLNKTKYIICHCEALWSKQILWNKKQKQSVYPDSTRAGENAPVTMVTSVPWERERDITEISPLWGTPSLQPFLKTYWLTPVNDWPIVAKHANMTSSRGSINAAPATITSESELNAAWLNEQRSRRSPWCLVPALREPRLP